MAGKVRVARKATKGKGKSWKKGYSSSSNPETRKHRENAKPGFFQVQGHTKLTSEMLARHNEGDTSPHKKGTKPEFSEEFSEGDTYNTFATVWSECTNPSFDRLMNNWQAGSVLHKEMLAIIAAVTEVIKERGGKETESEYFAALMTTLESVDTEESKAAVVTLLGMVMKRRLPASVLKLKFSDISKALIGVLASHPDNNAILRSTIGCLCSLLRSQELAVWNNSSTLQIYNALLSFTIHSKPKARKAAQHAVIAILKYSCIMTQPMAPTYHPAVTSTAKFCSQRLQESTGSGGITTKLHILALLQEILGLFPKAEQKSTCETILRLMTIGSPLVACCAFKTFSGVFIKRPSKDAHYALPAQLIMALHDYQPSLNDDQNMNMWLLTMKQGIIHIQGMENQVCLNHVVKLVSSTVRCWLSNNQQVLSSLAETIEELLFTCVKPIAANLTKVEKDSSLDSTASQIYKIVLAMENCLTYQYHSAWGHLLRVVYALIESVGKSCGVFTIKILRTIADLRDTPNFGHSYEVDKAIGIAIKVLGPQLVLEAVPFNIKEQDQRLDIPRSWLIPLLRDNVRSTELKFFSDYFFPLAVKLRNSADVLKSMNRLVESKTCDILQSQIWSILPGFCIKPTDLTTSFKVIAKHLGTSLNAHPDLRLYILSALRKLISHNSDNETNLKEMSRFAKNYLPILFNLYTTAPNNSTETSVRLAIYETIRSYLKITPQELIQSLFNKAHEKLVASDTDTFNRHALLDLCRAFLQYVDVDLLKLLFALCKPLLQNVDRTVQKKAYRVMEELCQSQSPNCQLFIQENLSSVQELFLGAISAAENSSKAPRLRCLSHIVQNLQNRNEKLVHSLVSEAVLCTKITSEKARTAAYQLLVDVARAEQRWSNDQHKAIVDYFYLVIGGLAGNPYLTSATLLALGKLFFEFHEEIPSDLTQLLIENVCLLMTSKSREIVQSTLAFFKTLIATIPQKTLEQFVPNMVRSMVDISEETQRPFRFKAKEIFIRLVRKFGFETIVKMVPEGHRKMLANIRKTEARKSRKSDDDENLDDEDEGKKRPMDELEAILEDSDAMSEEEEPRKIAKAKRKNRKNEAWIQEGEDDILDFLDPSANQKLTSTKPQSSGEVRKRKSNSEFKIAPDGRMIITELDEDLEKRNKNSSLDDITEAVDTIDLKGNRKRKIMSAGSDDEPIDDISQMGGGRGIRRKLGGKDSEDGSKYRAKKAEGDIKKKGQLDPYAYIPLNRQTLNKRKRAKFNKQFSNVVKSAKKGAAKGAKRKVKKH